jgi:hypothetical protein
MASFIVFGRSASSVWIEKQNTDWKLEKEFDHNEGSQPCQPMAFPADGRASSLEHAKFDPGYTPMV